MQKRKSDWGRDLIMVAVAVFVLNIGFMGIYMSIYNSFVADEIGIEPTQLGIVESIRESPGFLSAFIAALTMQIPSPVLSGVVLLIMAVGIGALSQVHTVTALTFWAVFWSVGFHCWAPLQPAMVLSLTKDERKGQRLGQMRRISNAAALLGMLIISFIGTHGIIRTMFIVSGFVIATAAFIIFSVSREKIHTKMPRLVMRRKYSLYYALMFLQGCRKQIFGTFAIFTLVRVYETRVNIVGRLMAVNKVVILIFAPVVGRIVDTIGERKSLSICYSCLALIFLGYGLIHNRMALYVLYCLDNLVFMFSIAVTTYLNRIAPQEDIRPTLSMGVTMDHVASVLVPVTGGLLWEAIGSYETIFFIGSAVAVISLVLVQYLKTQRDDETSQN
ncbi:MFS transporter [Candidatus Poribacteria bacterium]|nr:MFS transporter [Candidatus Poribacteria bacterium]